MPPLHVNHTVTISIKTRDWNPSALPMVGFSLQIESNVYVVATAPASSDGQTVSVTMKIPQINGHGPGPWACALRIAYCAAVQPDGHFIPNPTGEIQPIALGQVFI
jgi:hypothetical protein